MARAWSRAGIWRRHRSRLRDVEPDRLSERSGYTAIGTVCDVAARLCAEAEDGQILFSQRINAALKGNIKTEQVGALTLKGLTQPILADNVPPAAGEEAATAYRRGHGASAKWPLPTSCPLPTGDPLMTGMSMKTSSPGQC
jgi:hypothetical protein